MLRNVKPAAAAQFEAEFEVKKLGIDDSGCMDLSNYIPEAGDHDLQILAAAVRWCDDLLMNNRIPNHGIEILRKRRAELLEGLKVQDFRLHADDLTIAAAEAFREERMKARRDQRRTADGAFQ